MESNQGSNSVLFALDELREIEDDRLRTQRRREAELEAERLRLQKEREEMEREREEQRKFALELAERRASIEAQMKLEERRMALELERIPAPTLESAARPKWPWLLTVAVFSLAGLQFLMWQMQKNLDRSIKEVRSVQANMSTPVMLDPDTEPKPTPEIPTVVPPVAPTPDATPDPKSTRTKKTAKPPKPPPADPGVDCDNFKDPLGCMPKS